MPQSVSDGAEASAASARSVVKISTEQASYLVWSILRSAGFDAAFQCATEQVAAGASPQLLADLCASVGYFEEAYQCASETYASAPGARYTRLALFADAAGYVDVAARYSEQAVRVQSHRQTVEWIVWYINEAGAHSAAAHLLRAYERLASHDPRAPWWLAIALAASMESGGPRVDGHALSAERRDALLRAYALDPSVDAALPLQLVLAFRETGDWSMVRRVCSETLGGEPHNAEMAWQLSHAHWQCNDAAAAEAVMRAVDHGVPGDARVLAAIGMYLHEQARYEESEAMLSKALAADPSNVEASVDLAELELRRGAWSSAWPRFEARLAREDRASNHVVNVMSRLAPRWQGESLTDRTLVVHSEQGCGDDIQMVRYVPQLAARVQAEGGRLVLAVRRALQPLFKRFYGECISIEDGSPGTVHYVLPLASVPLVLDLRPGTVKGGAYLSLPDASLIDAWRERVAGCAPAARLRVGIVWCGSPTHRRDAKRSIPLAALKPLLALHDVAFYPLTPARHADVAALNELSAIAGNEPNVFNLTAHFETGFDDVAALLASLDLLVTIDSSPLHLGGALGLPVIALLDHVSHWAWGKAEEQAWYDSVQIIRQRCPGAWSEVVERAVARVEKRLRVEATHERHDLDS